MSRRVGARAVMLAGALCAGLSALGCAGAGAARLQGHWHGVRAEGAFGEAAAAANAFAASTSIDVRGDAMIVTQGGHRQAGRYRVVHEDASKVVLTTDADGPLDPYTFVFVDEDTIRWDVLAGKTIVFSRP
jgi:hypothetical protein